LAWIDPIRGAVLQRIPVAKVPHIGVFASHDCALVSYRVFRENLPTEEWLDVYRLSDWHLSARRRMDFQAHFNVRPRWSVFLPSPDGKSIYVYKALTLGHHLAEDYICGLDLESLEFASWSYKSPECVAGWSRAAGPAHAQLLFVSDGLETGQLPTGPLDQPSGSLDQKVSFWMGPGGGPSPTVSVGARPRVHSDPGHASAILYAPKRPLSVVVCDEGSAHLIDPLEFRYLEKQKVRFAKGHGTPPFRAFIEPRGRLLYVGTAGPGNLRIAAVERIVVHNLESRRREAEWILEEPLSHLALDEDGAWFYGATLRGRQLSTIDARTGRVVNSVELDGSPRYVVPAGSGHGE